MARDDGCWVPGHVREWLKGLGFSLPLEDMEPHIREWDSWMRADGDFYDYRDVDGAGRLYEVHRRSIRPAMRVCREWGSLLLDEKTQVVCGEQACTDWLAEWMAGCGFLARAQETVVRAYGLGTGAFAVWLDGARRGVRVRHYDARMVVPLAWDAEGVSECAFVTRAWWKGEPLDQVQVHRVGDGGRYVVETACFDGEGREVAVPGVERACATGCATPTFGIVRPAVPNTRVDCSPYGQSVFADAVDAIQSVDLAYDALINEVDVSKMRVFLSDVMFQAERDAGGRRVAIPFGKADCTVFRKVMSTEETITEFAPALRTEAQGRALRLALQVLGDLTGLGLDYFDTDRVGYVRTATEVSSDNSALMRNVRKAEGALAGALVDVSRAVMACARGFGEALPEEGEVSVVWDDSIVQDTEAEKAQDMREVAAGLLGVHEYRMRWYGEDEATARRAAAGLAAGSSGGVAPGGA